MLDWLNELLKQGVEMGASDVHLSEGLPVFFRINNDIQKFNDEPVSHDLLQDTIEALKERVGISTTIQDDILPDLDFAYEIKEVSRFRINVYKQLNGMSVSIRIIPLHIKDFDSLGLPSQLKSILKKRNGIFLVTGPTGSGKSTTLASLVQYMNKRMKKRIITLEEPVEFVYKNENCVIEQRQVGKDVTSFHDGIRSSLRQDPDVILVGEMRDLETISAAIRAAETGHLVLSTLHTNDAPKTIDRIVDEFPPNQQSQIRNQLASVLLGVISQQLHKRADGRGRVVATEFMIMNNAISNLIRKEQIHQIHSTMLTYMKEEGMHTLDSHLKKLIADGVIANVDGINGN